MIAQTLSIFEIEPEIMLWIMVIGGMTAVALHATELLLQWYTYNMILNKSTDLTVSNYYRAQSKLLLPYLIEDKRVEKMQLLAQLVVVYYHAEGWYWAQYYGLPTET